LTKALDRRDGYRIFYRLADPKQGKKKRLFVFLQGAYKNEEQLQADKKRLREAIESGSCTLSEWRPYSAVGGTKTMQANRA